MQLQRKKNNYFYFIKKDSIIGNIIGLIKKTIIKSGGKNEKIKRKKSSEEIESPFKG
jgi:hypothetical protein